MPKRAEAELAKMLNLLSTRNQDYIWVHKWMDARYCPNCHQLLYKVDDNVDYTIVVGTIAGLVECKEGDERFPWADEEQGIRPNQRKWLNQWTLLNRVCWLFLELGEGQAPKGRNAWLVPWFVWLQMENKLKEADQKSLPYQLNKRSRSTYCAEDMMKHYSLEWVAIDGWQIPASHTFFTIYGAPPKETYELSTLGLL